MSNQGKITSAALLKTVIFKEHAGATAGRKFLSLFPGLGYAAGYKVQTRNPLCTVTDGLVVNGTLPGEYRSRSESTNTAVSPSFATISACITATSLIMRLGRALGRQLCTRLLEGLLPSFTVAVEASDESFLSLAV